ncbi:hypothetical protein M409DRAFT_54241 [Zasmidium cellare ATCC 36951]|uniref:Uncharacterized protein n=1 Tax=Zasmidium cellare ATCC 36951 TaxID=1080233 RepID=A0A6A6CNI4_ZASCE|nr:uncharacterized protein M409DRAFT_54241 [Zasmidium cellare ATCC 36951]KAF2167026.1 hypothetical protein M409DRAFT_54241 [Zasmidium cellare ATCC 36951]
MALPSPPPNAPVGPRGYKRPPLSGRRCRICDRLLEADDRELCKHFQTQNAKPAIPLSDIDYNNEWGAYLGDVGEENIALRKALEDRRRRMPLATRSEVARSVESRWNAQIAGATHEAMAKPAEEQQPLPQIMAWIGELRRLIGALEAEEEQERRKKQLDEDFDKFMRETGGSGK